MVVWVVEGGVTGTENSPTQRQFITATDSTVLHQGLSTRSWAYKEGRSGVGKEVRQGERKEER